jgi:hypothetical protein
MVAPETHAKELSHIDKAHGIPVPGIHGDIIQHEAPNIIRDKAMLTSGVQVLQADVL